MNSTMFIPLFRQLFNLIHPFKKKLFAVCVTLVFFEFFKLVPTYILARLLDISLQFSSELSTLILILLMSLFLISNLVTLLEYFLDKKVMALLISSEIHILKQCQEKLLELPLKYHEEHFTGKQVNLIHQGVARIGELFFNAFHNFLPTLVQVLMSFSVMLFIHVQAAFLFFAFVPIFLFLTHRMGGKLQPLRTKYHEQFDLAAGKFAETIMHIRTVQDFAQETYEKKLYEDFLKRYSHLRNQRDRFERMFTAYRDVVLNIGRVSVLAYGVYLLATLQITPGFFVFLITLSEKAYLGLFRIGRTYNHVSDSFESVSRISNLLSQKSDPATVGFILEEAEARIVFEHVTFAYIPGQCAIRDVSFVIHPQETVAIVGKSGAGKSTLIKLLFRHFEADEGTIVFDGKEVKKISKMSLRRKMAIVSQDIELFHTTIRNNILYGHTASDDEFRAVCRIAHVDEFVQRFPKHYDTLVGERGVRLSGGQKQRVAIARALLRAPKLLIFDEATSSLDSESEYLIQKALWDISRDFTIIIIAHRLSTIEHADKVLVLDYGRLIENGTYQELVAKGGLFSKMAKIQQEFRK